MDKIKPLSLMSRGERILMLALNRRVREQAQGPPGRHDIVFGKTKHPYPAERRLQSCQEETCINTFFPRRAISQNCQVACSTSENCNDNVVLELPHTDEVCSLVNESAFQSGVLTSSSCQELNASENTVQLGKTTATSSG